MAIGVKNKKGCRLVVEPGIFAYGYLTIYHHQ